MVLVKKAERDMAVIGGGGAGEERVVVDSRGTSFALKQQHFVLIHGIGGGAWCWYKIRCLMENSGYKVSCIDLKGSGIDQSDADYVLSFDDYNKPLMDFMSALPENEQVILVGHSAGGLSVTQACHKFANKIRLAVYVAATMLKYGFLTDQDLKDGVPDLSEFGDVHEFGFGLGQDKPPTSAVVKKEFQRKIIYQLSPHEDSTLAAMLLRRGPVKALTSAKFREEEEEEDEDEDEDGDGDEEDVEKVAHVYIKTKHDNVMKEEQQEAMIKKWPPLKVYELDSDHSPFFSTPFLLFGFLVNAASAF